MPFYTMDRTTVLFPTISERALMDVTPLTLLSKLMATNQHLSYKDVAEYDLRSIFKG